MSLYRRRMFIYYFLFLLIIAQPLIYIYYSSNIQCDDDNKIEIIIPENITDREKIFDINTKILCWIPTTLKRLDRAIVVYE